LLRERKRKLDSASALIQTGDFKVAKSLFSEIFLGVAGKQADPGMAGSLLYHMAMVPKMETETRLLLEELKVKPAELGRHLHEPGEMRGDYLQEDPWCNYGTAKAR
jgi:hypothetical protein